MHGKVRTQGCRRARQYGFKIAAQSDAPDPLRYHDQTTRAVSSKSARSNRQSFAALGPPSIDHCTTAASLHTRSESMRACAANLGSLVGAFHDRFSPLVGLARRAGPYEGLAEGLAPRSCAAGREHGKPTITSDRNRSVNCPLVFAQRAPVHGAPMKLWITVALPATSSYNPGSQRKRSPQHGG
jgi:hypothetical protein